MVFFSCDGCGEVLKKNQVDGHAQRCRRCASVSCADCQVSFFGDDFRKHTSCLTEVERYEKKGQTPKKKEKLSPQEEWMDTVQSSVDSAPAHLKHYVLKIAERDNIPRKPKQFINFAANSLKLRAGNSVVTEIWDFLKSKHEEKRVNANAISKDEKMETIDKPTSSVTQLEQSQHSLIDDRKTLQQSDNNVLASTENAVESKRPAPDPKKVRKAMKTVLKKETTKSLRLKLLCKKVRVSLSLPKADATMLKKIVKSASRGEKFIVDKEKKVIALKVD
ncbi:hypothetical protein ACA910_005055 [Epithemia clementina (nom. ined.)]